MKNKLGKWKKEIEEVSMCVYKITLTHELGPSVQKIGHDLEKLEREVELSAIEIDNQIEEMIKTKKRSL